MNKEHIIACSFFSIFIFLVGILFGLSFKDTSFKISNCTISPVKYSTVLSVGTAILSGSTITTFPFTKSDDDNKPETGYNVRCY